MLRDEITQLRARAKDKRLAPWERSGLLAEADELAWQGDEMRRLAWLMIDACADPAKGRALFGQTMGESSDGGAGDLDRILVLLRGKLARAGLLPAAELGNFRVYTGHSPARQAKEVERIRDIALMDRALTEIFGRSTDPLAARARYNENDSPRSWRKIESFVADLVGKGLLDADFPGGVRAWAEKTIPLDKLRRNTWGSK